MSTHIALVDRSTLVSAGQLQALARALTDQCGHLAGAGYPIDAEVGVYGADSVPRDAWQLVLVDDSDVPGALGYHDRTAAGRPVAFAFARTAAEAGLNWTVTASHELVETLVDASARLGVDLGQDEHGQSWWLAWEACDPVEADADGYTIHVAGERGGNVVSVSNFVTPAWFDERAAGPYDWAGVLHEPLTLRPGGYAAVQVNGEWSQVIAEQPSPDGVSRAQFAHRAARRGAVQLEPWPVPEDLLLRVQRSQPAA